MGRLEGMRRRIYRLLFSFGDFCCMMEKSAEGSDLS